MGIALQALAGIVENEQAILEQLFAQRPALQWAVSLAQPGQGRAKPAAEQVVLHRVQRGHEQAFQAGDIQPMALEKSRLNTTATS